LSNNSKDQLSPNEKIKKEIQDNEEKVNLKNQEKINQNEPINFFETNSLSQTNNQKADLEFEFPDDELSSTKKAEKIHLILNKSEIENRIHDSISLRAKIQVSQILLSKLNITKSNSEVDSKVLTQQALQILRKNRFDKNIQKEAFEKLRLAADKKDFEACWMVAACYIDSIGCSVNREEAIKYSSKAMNAGISEGTFWFGRCFEGKRRCSIFKKAYQEGNLSGQNAYAYCYFKGKGIEMNRKKEMKLKRIVFQSGDRYWMMVYAYCLQKGLFDFKLDQKKS
jgi:TPR repeat protein